MVLKKFVKAHFVEEYKNETLMRRTLNMRAWIKKTTNLTWAKY